MQGSNEHRLQELLSRKHDPLPRGAAGTLRWRVGPAHKHPRPNMPPMIPQSQAEGARGAASR
eukprot:6332494-Alexandrium_andersonii.AAC.1